MARCEMQTGQGKMGGKMMNHPTHATHPPTTPGSNALTRPPSVLYSPNFFSRPAVPLAVPFESLMGAVVMI